MRFLLDIKTSFSDITVGFRTNNVIFIGVRNKYCRICAQASSKDPRTEETSCLFYELKSFFDGNGSRYHCRTIQKQRYNV